MKPYQFEHLKALPELVHGVSTAEYGNMSFIYGEPDEVKSSRDKFFQDLGVKSNQAVVTSLLHGDKINLVDETDRGKGIIEADSSLMGDILVTSKPDTYLFMVVADCLALFFYDQVNKVVALAHAGWKGVDQEVPFKTAFYLMKEHGCKAENILVGMSPALQKESACFETVDQRATPERKAKWNKYLSEKDNLVCVDTVSFAFDQLRSLGIPEHNIERSPIDTRTNTEFFSHRRSAETGEPEQRFACLIGFKSAD